MTIDDLLEKEGFNQVCFDCNFYHEWHEAHPYGMGHAYESMAECKADSDGDCPRLING